MEAEADLAFAGLHGLLRPVMAHLRDVPETQSRALAGALGLGPSTHSDRLLISAAVLSLLAAAAERRPVLCVVDDAQWLDQPSADALVFTARRLQAETLVLLFGARDGEVRRFEAAGLAELPLTGLGPAPAAAVLSGRARNAAAAVRERLLAEAEGNPLALLELPAGLSQAQLEGRALELFQRLGAVPWAERAEVELRATGETARKRDQFAVTELTPQELQIAGLVTDGLTNREIAAQLFLSPRTVDYHLRKVFTKLGIGSRTEV